MSLSLIIVFYQLQGYYKHRVQTVNYDHPRAEAPAWARSCPPWPAWLPVSLSESLLPYHHSSRWQFKICPPLLSARRKLLVQEVVIELMNSSNSSSPARNSPSRGSSKKSSFATGGSRFSISTMANGTDHFSATSRTNKIKNNNASNADKNGTTSNGSTTNDTSPSSSAIPSLSQHKTTSGRIRRRSAPPVTLEGKFTQYK